MKKTKMRAIVLILMLVCMTQICACQQKPEREVITSKNDGAFDIGILRSADEEHIPNATQEVLISDNFYSTDGSVHFVFDLDINVRASNMPVVQVTPHALSVEDGKRVAEVLFGDIQGYERTPSLAPQYSKAEIQECIARWAPYTSNDGVKALYGIEDDFTVEVVKKKIEALTLLSDSVPDHRAQVPCKWEFQKEAYYMYSAEDAPSAESYLDNDAIMATFELNEISYSYDVVTRDKNDYKLNVVSAFLNAGDSPLSIDEAIYKAQLCRTHKPTQEEIRAVKAKAQDMLERMNLGEWSIDQCYVNTTGDFIQEYTIHVNAVPVFNGVPAARQPQLTDLKSETVYASNYYITETSFIFSANGDLVSFRMTSPVDIKNVINENVAVMEMEELMEITKNHLKHSDFEAYDLRIPGMYAAEELAYTVNLCNFYYGLLRVKVPNTDESYYYVPGMMLEGIVEITGKDSGELYYMSEAPQAVLALNAVDGTIIELSNG